MSGCIIAEWQINAREKFRVRLDVFQGRNVIDLRRWFSTGGGNDYRPGNKGVTIAVRHVPALAEALNAALAQLANAGIIDGVG